MKSDERGGSPKVRSFTRLLIWTSGLIPGGCRGRMKAHGAPSESLLFIGASRRDPAPKGAGSPAPLGPKDDGFIGSPSDWRSCLSTLQSVERRARQLLAELCSTHTQAGSEGLLLPLLERELRALGASLRFQEIEPGRANVLATWGEPRLLYSTHLDVVPPDLPAIEGPDGRLHGRGTIDAKGQIAAQLAAIGLLLEAGLRDVAWLGVCGEETDSIGAETSLLLEPHLAACRALVVGEPTGSALAAGQKGFIRARLSCSGRTAHGGTPELGENAIEALIDWLSRLRAARPGFHATLGREVLNIGTISGGRAANVVADRAEAELTLRTVPGGFLREALAATRPATGSVEILVEDPPAFFELPPGFPSAPVPFGSDLPMMRPLAHGGAAVLAGPGDARLAHTEDESVSGEELSAGIALFRDLGLHFLGRSR